MSGLIDVVGMVTKCLNQSSFEPLTARTVASYLTSPYAIYCEKFVSETEQDVISKYQQLLFERGKEHETDEVKKKYPDMVPIPFISREEGFKLAMESMANGSKAMRGMPLFYLPKGLLGTVDIMEKAKTGSSRFGFYADNYA